MRNPLLKYVMKTKKDDVAHTSVYGKAQGGGIGATSAQSFKERMKIEKNRQMVRGYEDSRIVTQTFRVSGRKAKTYNAAAESARTAGDDAVISIRANGPKAPGSKGDEKAVTSIRANGPKAPGAKGDEGAITSLRAGGPRGPRGREQDMANLRAQGQARAQVAARAPRQPLTIHKNPGISR